ncbi:MAG: DUF2147 domain-containing protein [Flavobacteriales bacterium]|nr:DUF2147 domain-containing protein [Flavobacteriales bacterium]
MEIYKTASNKYEGKIVWLRESLNSAGKPKLDVENPEPGLRKRKKLGLVILKDFVFDADDNEWEDGSIYDAARGKTYSAYMWSEDGTMSLKGYVLGMPFLGSTSEWTLVQK